MHADLLASLQSLHVLVVGADTESRAALLSEVDAAGHRGLRADDGRQAVELFHQRRPDVVLLGVDLPGGDGFDVARELRRADSGDWTPILFVSPSSAAHDVWQGIEAGGDDYLVSPIAPMILQAKLRAMQRLVQMRERLVEITVALQAANVQLHELATVDALTGLLNRRALDDRLQREVQLARRTGTTLTVMLCDVDFFKRYNDSLGHAAGDACLRRVAALFSQCCRRPGDFAARYGGEEFVLVLPDTPAEGAAIVARHLREIVHAAALPHPASEAAGHVTVSGGVVSCLPGAATTPAELLERADGALYRAKALGRDRVEAA